jgi:ELWxxDGT repeat protein
MKKNLLLKVMTGHESRLIYSKVLLLFIAVMFGSIFRTQAQVSIVKDIASGNENDPEAFGPMIEHGDGNLYFQYYQELWKSDGTTAGTVPVKNFDYMTNIVSSGDYIYFTADRYDENEEVQVGHELWRSDGTPEGTVLLKDIYPGEANGNIHDMTDVNGTLFFVANNGINGEELWKSDGTSAGTRLVKDILRVAGSSKPRDLTALNGKVYFSANDGQKGFELWTSDGTEAGTMIIQDINPAAKASSSPEQMLNVNGTLYFFANDGINRKQLWKSNGAIGNATLVKVIRPGANNFINLLAKLGDEVFFEANDGVHGSELWKSNGTDAGTFMVKDITPGPGSATQYATPHIEFLNESNGKIYFLGVAEGWLDLWVSDGTEAGTYPITAENDPGFPWRHFGLIPYHGLTYFGGMGNDENSYLELWKSDGTFAGTSMLYDNIGDGYYGNIHLTVYKDKIYFFLHGELYLTDGTAPGKQFVQKFGPQSGSAPQELTDVDGELFFKTGSFYSKIWKSNGTAEGTIEVSPGFRYVSELTNVNGTVYFAGTDYQGNAELWKNDGTVEGTTMVVDLTTDPNAENQSSMPKNLIEYNGALYFTALTPWHGFHLFTSDGTAAGTRTVMDAEYHEQGFANPEQLTKAGGKLFFTAISGKGNELFVYDGVNQPALTRDIKIHYMGSYPINLTEYNGILYFQADNRGNGYELWRSDGTTAGTYIMKDIRRDDLGSGETLAPVDMGGMMATSDLLFFSAIKPNGINALWKSDGTGTGTRPIVEFAGTPQVHLLAASGNTITYVLQYDSYVELWKSNGTVAGTTMIRSIPEMRYIDPSKVETLNEVHYFVGYDFYRYQIWRTDGTTSGTYEIQSSGIPHELKASGGKLYLSLDNPDYGWELFTIDDNGAGLAGARLATETELISETEDDDASFTNYPNPFKSDFSLRVTGEDDQVFQMKVLSSSGAIVDHGNLKYNTDHIIGQRWQDGFYILQVYTDNKIITRKIIKGN